jgi:hypothetical protein
MDHRIDKFILSILFHYYVNKRRKLYVKKYEGSIRSKGVK